MMGGLAKASASHVGTFWVRHISIALLLHGRGITFEPPLWTCLAASAVSAFATLVQLLLPKSLSNTGPSSTAIENGCCNIYNRSRGNSRSYCSHGCCHCPAP